MSEKELHHSVGEFKNFINDHPKLIVEIRKNGRPLQEYYEKWILNGENDPIWDEYKDKEVESKQNYSELFGHIIKYAENMDLTKVQKQMNQLNNTIQTIQAMLNGFIESKNTSTPPKKQTQLFTLFRD